jgi:flavin reductase (DIM6/NTAB) family NADH-FMN oxidoreductase RutF
MWDTSAVAVAGSGDTARRTVDGPDFRRVLSHYASGVTIVTASSSGEPVGFACQSFHSLSLDPPMVVLLPGRSSTSWPRIRTAGRFAINILAEHQAELCRGFAVSGGDKFADVAWSASPAGSPVLDECLAWIDCELHDEYDGGDHLIAVARVLDLEACDGRAPLLFHRGSFVTLAGSSRT